MMFLMTFMKVAFVLEVEVGVGFKVVVGILVIDSFIMHKSESIRLSLLASQVFNIIVDNLSVDNMCGCQMIHLYRSLILSH